MTTLLISVAVGYVFVAGTVAQHAYSTLVRPFDDRRTRMLVGAATCGAALIWPVACAAAWTLDKPKAQAWLMGVILLLALLAGAVGDGMTRRDATHESCVAQAELVSVTISGDCRMVQP